MGGCGRPFGFHGYMSKRRYINTKFWDDSNMRKLTPTERYLYLYFLTNPLTNLAGAYEISVDRMEFDTGLESEDIENALESLEGMSRIFYKDGWLLIKNHIKHQSKAQKIRKGIESLVNDCPHWIKDTLCIEYEFLSHLISSNLNLNIDLNSISSKPETVTVPGDDDAVLRYYSEVTGNQAKASDKKARLEVGHVSPVVCKIGIRVSAIRCKNPIRSFKYCLGAINDIHNSKLENPDDYLGYLEHRAAQV